MDISPCSHEEVDTRIFLQAKDAVDKGFAKVVIKATDRDMVVIGTSLFNEIGAGEIWIEFGISENLKYIPIHEIQKGLDPTQGKGLLFFHALTGCDSTTAFAGFGKVSAWKLWTQNLDIFKDICEKLSLFDFSLDLENEDINLIENFVSALYQRSENLCSDLINETRKKLFLTKGLSLDKLPPTSDALNLKI